MSSTINSSLTFRDETLLPFFGSGRCTLFQRPDDNRPATPFAPNEALFIQRKTRNKEENEAQQSRVLILCSFSCPHLHSSVKGTVLYYDECTTVQLETSLPDDRPKNSMIIVPCSAIRNNNNNTVDGMPITRTPAWCNVYSSPQPPEPLLSISLQQQCTTETTLFLTSCIKRCLIGRIVILDCSTSVNVDNILLKYKVLQLVPKQSNAQKTLNNAKNILSSPLDQQTYRILPSTIITLLSNEDTTNENMEEQTQLRDLVPNEIGRQVGNTLLVLDDKATDASRTLSYNSHPILLESMVALRRAIDYNLDQSPSFQDGNMNGKLDVPRSFLLSGPQGVGKTYSVQTAIATFRETFYNKNTDEHCCHLFSIRGSEILYNNNNIATALEGYFENAAISAGQSSKSISVIFLDECDALMDNNNTAAQLCYLLDRVSSIAAFEPGNDEEKNANKNNCIPTSSAATTAAWDRILVIAATNRVEAIPDWVRRPGRLDREIILTPPNAKERCEILRWFLSQISCNKFCSGGICCCAVCDQEGLSKVAEECVGYVAADIAALVREAILLATTGPITCKHLVLAKDQVGASALRDSAITAPPATSWDDIAGNAGGAKEALRRAVEWPRTKRVAFRQLGLSSPRGILLYGPPGCAKTTLARAAAGAAGIAFISLSPAEVFASSYVGEAESIVRRAFALARSVAPCILFFDEIDSIIGTDSSSHGMGREASSEARVLSTFLNEMDGVDSSPLDGVLCLGATNRPMVLDAALLRPGRFDKVIYVPPPDEASRRSIFSLQLAKAKCCHTTIDLDYLASNEVSGRLTGAEIVGACQEALMLVLREHLENIDRTRGDSTLCAQPVLTQRHLDQTLKTINPLLTDKMLAEYRCFEEKSV